MRSRRCAKLILSIKQQLVQEGEEKTACVNVMWCRQSCLEFDSASYLKRARAAAGTPVAAMDAADSPEPE